MTCSVSHRSEIKQKLHASWHHLSPEQTATCPSPAAGQTDSQPQLTMLPSAELLPRWAPQMDRRKIHPSWHHHPRVETGQDPAAGQTDNNKQVMALLKAEPHLVPQRAI